MQVENIVTFLLGGVACGVTSFMISSFFKRPAEIIKRMEYALLSGIGATAICWLAYRYYPEKFDPYDAIPYSILIGFFGLGRVLDWIAKKYGIDKIKEKAENHDSEN